MERRKRRPWASRSFFGGSSRLSRPAALGIDRVVVAMEDRRESMPVRELLDLRLCGVVIENSSSLMERLSGKLPLDGLNPSVLIFTEGFRMSTSQQLFRRLLSFAVSFIALTHLPAIPAIDYSCGTPLFAGTNFFQPDARRATRAFVHRLQVPHHAARL